MSDKEKFLGRITGVIMIVTLLLSVGGMLWAFSANSTKALQAYDFVAINHNLPTVVKNLENRTERIDKRLCAVERLATSVERLNGNINVLSSQIEDMRNKNDGGHQ